MGSLLNLAMTVLRCILAFFRSRNEQAIVELALRQQLATYTSRDPSLGSRQQTAPSGSFVQPDIVIRWHHKDFRLYWRSISKRGPGRPPIPLEVQALIRRFANENGWRARKVQAELEKLGFHVSLATVSRYLQRRIPDLERRQSWTTFLQNHRDAVAAMDFLVVPTVRFKLLYIWFVVEHGRRRVHVNATSHPILGSRS